MDHTIQAVRSNGGWHDLGTMTATASELRRLRFRSYVTASGLTGTIRLWDASTRTEVVNSAISFANVLAPATYQSTTAFSVVLNREYIFQAQCVGTAAPDASLYALAGGVTTVIA